mmetsp:Transcript_57753/g.150128  ORF Transcript_57753/g.150128 Transcript_57753/m.150128 type:complete len:315 (+) Transcript_57753:225-1169(+)
MATDPRAARPSTRKRPTTAPRAEGPRAAKPRATRQPCSLAWWASTATRDSRSGKEAGPTTRRNGAAHITTRGVSPLSLRQPSRHPPRTTASTAARDTTTGSVAGRTRKRHGAASRRSEPAQTGTARREVRGMRTVTATNDPTSPPPPPAPPPIVEALPAPPRRPPPPRRRTTATRTTSTGGHAGRPTRSAGAATSRRWAAPARTPRPNWTLSPAAPAPTPTRPTPQAPTAPAPTAPASPAALAPRRRTRRPRRPRAGGMSPLRLPRPRSTSPPPPPPQRPRPARPPPPRPRLRPCGPRRGTARTARRTPRGTGR